MPANSIVNWPDPTTLKKTDPEVDNVGPYGGGWCCDVCRKSGSPMEVNYRNLETNYDLCQECYEKCLAGQGKEQEYKAPIMTLLDFKNKKFWFALDESKVCNQENIRKIVADFNAGKL